ncbi:sensor histidine kinase [Gemmobacter sp.]|uniref:sensor histidine kinase n=1 Tax=Gemmobacter sp. TaxID=1898957 RepID=UPI002AFF8704|nr:ATP-binding protein [Gemmobacter sp.]
MGATGKRILAIGLAMLLIALAVGHAERQARRSYLSEAQARSETALGLTTNALAAYLARYEVTPQLLAELDAIRLLVAYPDDQTRRATINRLLEDRNAVVGSSDIYIMDMGGETIAASNHARPDSFIGQNFSYRPYFYDAAQGQPARFYALGTTSGVRGYYFSAPVRDPDGRIAGVIAVKVGVDALEMGWRGSEYRILVTDPEGIVFLSSEPDWLYGSILPLTPDRLARTEASRRYSDAVLRELPVGSSSSAGVALVRMAADGATRDHVSAAQAMPSAGWTVHVLLDSAGALTDARIATAGVALALCLIGVGALVVLQRRLREGERLAFEAQAKAELEARVRERTADLARVNSHLEQEVAERKATEAALRSAQANLVQVGKLAALGQMSAALSHEINQPLAAARNYADSAAIFLDRGDVLRARENIRLILSLVDRIAAIGRHLRNAARKPNQRLEPVPLPALLEETQVIVSGRLASSGAMLLVDLPPGLPPVMAGATRLQQVLVNLVTNAADAVEGLADRRIQLSARQQGDRVVIRVRDHGPGVPAAIAERIFDPFFTTKGVGLGLGLSISYNIVKDFGGDIALRDAAPGAEFTVTLPAALATEAAA